MIGHQAHRNSLAMITKKKSPIKLNELVVGNWWGDAQKKWDL
jgi:hypothetical protein